MKTKSRPSDEGNAAGGSPYKNLIILKEVFSMKKTMKKILALGSGAALLVTASVMGTMAYLTSTSDAVENTFTIGQVAITLDEADVKPDGTREDTTTRVIANTYHLLPGHEYVKDPIVHVNAISEDCYVFVKVENGISAYEAATDADYTQIATQITNNGWTKLDEVANVYYMTYTKNQDDKDLEVFDEFKISGTADAVAGWANIKPETTKINVNAYAVQKDGFTTAKAAWDATFGAN